MGIILSSCGSDSRPDGILPEDEMVPILMEVYLSEGRLSNLNLKRDSALQVYLTVEGKIFEKYNTTDSIYRASMIYYYDHPKDMEKIYEVLLDSLNIREQKMTELGENDLKKTKEKETGSAQGEE